MNTMLEACSGLPTRAVAEGEVLVREGDDSRGLFVVVSGAFVVARQTAVIARIDTPGAVIGEVGVLLDSPSSATVTATEPSVVHEITDAEGFIAADPARLLELARTLARRLDRVSSYLSDVRTQYGAADGHFGLLDEILAELTHGDPPTVELGSEREPDPPY